MPKGGEMSKSSRLRALLANGYFPEELPPPFQTADFAKYRQSIGTAWGALQQDYPKSTPEVFSFPRQHGWRRDFSIVNPIAQYHLSKLISDNWIAIKAAINPSFSAQKVALYEDGRRAVPKPDFELVRLRHAEVSALYDYVLVADISRFYGTLYTHAIPWALHTKAWCKTYLNTPPYNTALGARLDRAVRKGNDNQTIGIPIGPDTSRILSEIAASSVDRVLEQQLSIDDARAVRHVDDWYIGFDSLGEAESAMASLAAACRDLQLEIHPEKTRCLHIPRETPPPWSAALRSMIFAKWPVAQRRSIEHFFSEAFHFAAIYKQDNVLGYAVSRTRNLKVHADNWHTYETFLLRAARSNSTTLPHIVQILVSYNASGYTLDKPRIRKLIIDLIRNAAPMAFHAEVAWALFLAKGLGIALPASSLQPVCELESSVCALISLDLRSRGLVEGTLDTSLWEQSMNAAGLVSNMWLLSYEADIKGWLVGTASHVTVHPYFRELKSRGVSFYDTARNVPHIKKAKPKPPSDELSKLLAIWSQTSAPQPAIAQSGPTVFLGGYWDGPNDY
jgi:hypothetical protein